MITRIFNLRKARRRMAGNFEDPNVPLTGHNVAEALGWTFASTSGIPVNSHVALGYSAVWSAVDQISSEVSRLPWQAYRRLEKGRELLPSSHPVQKLLRFPDSDEFLTCNIWLTRMMGHALLHGNAFAKIWRSGSERQPIKLEFIHSTKVKVRRERGRTWYDVTWNEYDDGPRNPAVETLDTQDMFHLQGLTISEFGGLSLVSYARNTIGRMIAAEVYGDDFLKNSAVPQGFFTHPGNITEPAQNRFLSQMEKRFGSAGQRHRLGFLEEDMKWQAIGINPKDAMLVDMLKLGPEDVARFFSMPAHKLGSEKRTGWNTTEQENTAWYNETIGRWTNRLVWESLKLFDSNSEMETHYTAFDTDQLIRANTKERYEAHSIAVAGGWKTRNEVRAAENLNPLPGLDEVLTPLNMANGPQVDSDDEEAPDEPASEPQPAPEPPAGEDDARAARLLLAHREVVADKLALMGRRIGNAAQTAAGKPERFLAFINSLEADHGKGVRESLRASAELIAATFHGDSGEVLNKVCADLFAAARDRLLAAAEVSADELPASVAAAAVELQAKCKLMATDWITGG